MKPCPTLRSSPRLMSPPAWGAWIETITIAVSTGCTLVAPRVGGVD